MPPLELTMRPYSNCGSEVPLRNQVKAPKHTFLLGCATSPFSRWAHFSLFQLRRAERFWLLATFLWLSSTKVRDVSSLCLEVCLLFHSVRRMAGSLIRLISPPFQNQPRTFPSGIVLLFLLLSKHVNRQEMSSTTRDTAWTQGVSCCGL